MIKKEQTILEEAMSKAIIGQEIKIPDADMKYCMIVNMGAMPILGKNRAQIFVSNQSLNTTAGAVRFTGSGLSNDDFVHSVANALDIHHLSGRIADLKLYCEGCFSLRVAPEIFDEIDKHFPPERLTFLSFDTSEDLKATMSGYKANKDGANYVQERPYLDA